MIDILKDIVKHTHGLGFLDLVKITGDDKETVIDSMAEDRSVILQGSFHKPQTEMTGTFGARSAIWTKNTEALLWTTG